MSSKSSLSKKEDTSLPPRRVHAKRRNKSRASASPGRGPLNNGLMTAAWPKTPTYRPPKAKASDNATNQRWSMAEKNSHSTDQVEEMEVDSHDTSVMLSLAASAEFNLMKTQIGTSTKKLTSASSPECRATVSSKSNSIILRDGARRLSEPAQVQSGSSLYRVRRSDSLASRMSAGKEPKLVPERQLVNKAQANPTKNLNLPPVFIVLHVGKIDFGLASGPATGPVKIYAERIMVQMENEITKQELSFRIICRDIRELEASLENQPFFLRLKTSDVHFTNQRKLKAKGEKNTNVHETLTFHLAYETEVPSDVKKDLRDLFKDRLSHLNLWKEVNSSPVRNVSPLTDRSPRSPGEKRKLETNEIRKVDDEEKGCRKRTPIKESDEEIPISTTQDIKVARRVLFQEANDYQERIKSLENEAAHYQLMLGHKRLEVQHLKEQLSERENESILARQDAQREIAAKDRDVSQLQSQIDTFKLQINLEKEVTNNQRRQISELQRTVAEKNLAVEEQQQAILVRDSQLKEVRAIATSPSKMTESELRERVKRLENNLRQTRSTLEETRRSKNGISEELRRNVDILANLREQLRSEISRNRRFGAEKTAAQQQINDLVGSKRALQIELNDERERIASLERERLSNHRRIEDEVNRRTEAEDELAGLRSRVEEKQRLIEDLRSERDNAVTEVGILKREVIHLNDQAGEARAGASSARQPGAESQDWIIDRSEVIVHNNVLGEGGWGQVKRGQFRGTEVAVKQIHQLILSPHNRRLFNREMTIASRCRHPCLLQFIGATCDDGIPLFVSELMETDLRSCLSRQALKDSEILTVGLDVALALNYLHKQRPMPIIHRDISSANVLIWYKGMEMHGKLSDYGAANFMRLSMTRHPGASLYSAPETASGDQTTKIDVYSFGVLFCEMSIRELPVIQQRIQQICYMQKNESRELVWRCIETNPASRPSADEIIDLFTRWKSQKQ